MTSFFVTLSDVNVFASQERLGEYTYRHQYINGYDVYTNNIYYIYNRGGTDGGWQWSKDTNMSNGIVGPLDGDAYGFINSYHILYYTASYTAPVLVPEVDKFLVTRKSGTINQYQLGTYTKQTTFTNNGSIVYSNNNYYIYYGGNDIGWQWNTAVNTFSGQGPLFSDYSNAFEFINSSHTKTQKYSASILILMVENPTYNTSISSLPSIQDAYTYWYHTFTATQTSKFKNFAFSPDSDIVGNLTLSVEIRDGSGISGTLLYNANWNIDSYSPYTDDNNTWVDHTISSNVDLTNNNTYSILLTYIDGTAKDFRGSTDNRFGGRFHRNDLPGGHDLAMQIWVEPVSGEIVSGSGEPALVPEPDQFHVLDNGKGGVMQEKLGLYTKQEIVNNVNAYKNNNNDYYIFFSAAGTNGWQWNTGSIDSIFTTWTGDGPNLTTNATAFDFINNDTDSKTNTYKALLELPDQFYVLANGNGDVIQERLGLYTKQEIVNNVNAYKNNNNDYYIFFDATGTAGWQWNTGSIDSFFTTWAGDGPNLTTNATAFDFINNDTDSKTNNYKALLELVEPEPDQFYVLDNGNGDVIQERLGLYTKQEIVNNVNAYKNNNNDYYIFLSATGTRGWQWNTGSIDSIFTTWDGDGPNLTTNATAFDFINNDTDSKTNNYKALLELVEPEPDQFYVLANGNGDVIQESLGLYTKQEIVNNVNAYKNNNNDYYIFFDATGTHGWQWNTGSIDIIFNTWAGDGPNLTTNATAFDFINNDTYSKTKNYKALLELVEPEPDQFYVLDNGNVIQERLGLYTKQEIVNNVNAYKNNNNDYYIFFSATGTHGWQWNTGSIDSIFNTWDGDGPNLTTNATAFDFINNDTDSKTNNYKALLMSPVYYTSTGRKQIIDFAIDLTVNYPFISSVTNGVNYLTINIAPDQFGDTDQFSTHRAQIITTQGITNKYGSDGQGYIRISKASINIPPTNPLIHDASYTIQLAFRPEVNSKDVQFNTGSVIYKEYVFDDDYYYFEIVPDLFEINGTKIDDTHIRMTNLFNNLNAFYNILNQEGIDYENELAVHPSVNFARTYGMTPEHEFEASFLDRQPYYGNGSRPEIYPTLEQNCMTSPSLAFGGSTFVGNLIKPIKYSAITSYMNKLVVTTDKTSTKDLYHIFFDATKLYLYNVVAPTDFSGLSSIEVVDGDTGRQIVYNISYESDLPIGPSKKLHLYTAYMSADDIINLGTKLPQFNVDEPINIYEIIDSSEPVLFINQNASIYPLTFTNSGKITFDCEVISGESVQIQFILGIDFPYSSQVIGFFQNRGKYFNQELIITPTGTNTFNSLQLKLVGDLNSRIELTNIRVYEDPNPIRNIMKNLDTFDIMKNKSDPELNEVENVITFTTTYFNKFTRNGTDSEKRAQTKDILRQTLNKFSASLSGKKIVVSKDDVNLPHAFSIQKQNIQVVNPGLLTNNELDLVNDLNDDEGFYVDLENEGDFVNLKINSTSSVKVEKVIGGYNVTETDSNNNIHVTSSKQSGDTGQFGTLIYTLGTVSGEIVLGPGETVLVSGSTSNTVSKNTNLLLILGSQRRLNISKKVKGSSTNGTSTSVCGGSK